MSIILAHIEPIEERYTKQWLDSIKDSCKLIVGDQKIQTIIDGEFLDVTGTNKFKLEQGLKIIEHIGNGLITNDDTILFLDLWNPVVCNIAYIRDCMGLKFKIAGLLHAGTWDQHDFLHKKNLQKWSKGLEKSIIQVADKIIVATEFHKKMIETYFNTNFENIIVEKFPIFTPNYKQEKENIVVFPHRLAPEKQPHLFDQLKKEYTKKYNDKIEWIKTKDVWTNKDNYYKLLAKAKVSVSFALQETFGIAMLESLNLGCIPYAPNRLSYKETLPDHLYNDMNDLIDKIHNSINNYNKPKPYTINNFDQIIKLL